MSHAELSDFRLVGGTALSLYLGHRISIDIDLFTDANYGSVNFERIDTRLRNTFPYVDSNAYNEIGMGKSYYVGEDKQNCIKLDLYYTEPFMDEMVEVDQIRLASKSELAAMKIDVIARTGRKKDFWDIDELKNHYTISEMVSFHEQRHPFTHNLEIIKTKLTDFSGADEDFNPICLKGKHWELVKLDMIDLSDEL
jgi:hypothetical protein